MPVNNPIRYFASYCVMASGGNPFGHSTLIISSLDTRDPNAKVEVQESVGFYSRYLPVVGYKPVTAHGRVKSEAIQDVVRTPGLSQVTFEISQAQLGRLLTEINHDRRIDDGTALQPMQLDDVDENDQPIQRTIMAHRPSGPAFNMLIGRNCKAYALQKLANIGIDVRFLSGFLEIPKLSQGLQPLWVETEQRLGQNVHVWKTPLLVSPTQPQGELSPEQLTWQQFDILQKGMQSMITILKNRQQELLSQSRSVPEINIALNQLQQQQAELQGVQAYPNLIDAPLVEQAYQGVANTVETCIRSLNDRHIEMDLISAMKAAFSETLSRMTNFLFGTSVRSDNPNYKDVAVVGEVERVHQQVQFSKLRF